MERRTKIRRSVFRKLNDEYERLNNIEGLSLNDLVVWGIVMAKLKK